MWILRLILPLLVPAIVGIIMLIRVYILGEDNVGFKASEYISLIVVPLVFIIIVLIALGCN